MKTTTLRLLIPGLFCLFLLGCGGGSSSNNTTGGNNEMTWNQDNWNEKNWK